MDLFSFIIVRKIHLLKAGFQFEKINDDFLVVYFVFVTKVSKNSEIKKE